MKCEKCGKDSYWDNKLNKCMNPACIFEMKPVEVHAPIKYKNPNILDRAWLAVNNKKTVIGVSAIALGKLATIIGHPEIGIPVEKGGELVAFGGGIHKALKGLNSATSGDNINWEEVIKMVVNILKKFIKLFKKE